MAGRQKIGKTFCKSFWESLAMACAEAKEASVPENMDEMGFVDRLLSADPGGLSLASGILTFHPNL